jgi:hypothetical protein
MQGRDEGQALIESADTWMQNQEIRNPEAICAMLAPGEFHNKTQR